MIDARLTEVLVDKYFNVLRNRQKSGGSLNGKEQLLSVQNSAADVNFIEFSEQYSLTS